jgi:predicted dehydrogenase
MSRIGIIGCGNIAPLYARTLNELGWVEIAAFADGLPDRAERFAAKYGGAAMSVDEMLADGSIEAVVNLTPPLAHVAVSRSILAAGKHAFSEKPLGVDFQEGVDLLTFAAAQQRRLGCAPDTFLGAGLQAARSAIDRGLIGEPLAANAFFQGFGPEWWHPNPEFFYEAGAGPMFDMGPYYLTALTHLLGPARSISASARIGMAERIIHAKGRVGDVITPTVPTHVASIIDFVSGPTATLVTSFDVKASRYRNIEIYGSEATLAIGDPNMFDSPLSVRSLLNDDWRPLSLPSLNVPQQRGVGLADMLSAERSGRPHRASAELALHVLELMTSAIRSSDEGRRIELTTTCERPAPMRFDLPTNQFD